MLPTHRSCFAKLKHLMTLPALAVLCSSVDAQTTELPLFKIEDMRYEGAFRFPATEFGASSLNFSEGPVAYNPANHSIFIVGHSHHQAIAEFAIPPLVNSANIDDLNMSGPPLQTFSSVLGRPDGGNTQNIDRIGGMLFYPGPKGPELIVNAYEYYDAPGDNSHTTLAIRDASDLAETAVEGFYQFEGGAGHTSGWISPIPPQWQNLLGGTHLTGQSSGIPIISRTSVGPSAFAFNPLDIVSEAVVPSPIPTVKLLDFTLRNPLHDDLHNASGDNQIWTHLSRVGYGLIVPGTRTYLTVGYSGGHRSGVCYKCIQDNDNLCGGYCAPEAADYYQYYWLWDINDLIGVKEGRLNAYEVRPYAYGEFVTPFQNSTRKLGGGSFDPESGLLYLTVQKADRDQGRYANPPVVVAYRFDLPDNSSPPTAVESASSQDPQAYQLSEPYPNPFNHQMHINLSVGQRQRASVEVYDMLGKRVAVLFKGTLPVGQVVPLEFSAPDLASGIYLIRAKGQTFSAVRRVALLK